MHAWCRQLRSRRARTEPIGDAPTVQLAETGFDEAWEPNAGGLLIEDLIDRLFVPSRDRA